MAVIRNLLETIIRVRDAAQSAREIDKVTRATNRLGNSSAANSRQFAAQAKGAGALVGAYAGAAANIFALQQAFSALSRASRLEQTVAGVNTLAAAIGEAGPRILDSIQDITKGQLTLAESAQTLNLALSSGFNSDQIERISTVALKASRALGRDLQDSFTRLVRGAAKLEPELLDELGIFARIEPAAQAYALANNKVASSLTRVEKQQAFVNAVITEGERKFKDINTTVPTASESLEQFGTSIINAATEVGLFLAQSLQPFFQFFTENVGAQLGAVGLLANQIVGPAIGLLGGKFDKTSKSLKTFAVVAERVGSEFTQADRASRERIQTAFSNIAVTNAGTAALNNQLKVLREAAKSNTLTIRQINENINALRAQRTQLLAKLRVVRADIAAAQASGQATDTLTRRLALLQQQLLANRRATVSTSAATRSLAASFGAAAAAAASFAATSIAFVGRLFTGFLGIITTITTLISLFTIFGTSIAKAAGKGAEFNQLLRDIGDGLKQFLGFDKAAQTAKKAFASAANSAINANEELRDIDSFTFDSKVLGIDVVVTRTKEDIVNDIVGIQLEADRLVKNKTDVGAVLTGAGIGGTLGVAIGGAIGVALGSGILSVFTGAAGANLGGLIGAALGGAAGKFFSNNLLNPDEIKKRFAKLNLSNVISEEKLDSDDYRALAGATLEALENVRGTTAQAELYRRTIAETAFGLANVSSEAFKLQQISEATGIPFTNLEQNAKNIKDILSNTGLPDDFAATIDSIDISKIFPTTDFAAFLDIGNKIAGELKEAGNTVRSNLSPSFSDLRIASLRFGIAIETANNQLIISADLARKFEEDLGKGFSSSEALASSFIAQNTSLNNITNSINEAQKRYDAISKVITDIKNKIDTQGSLTDAAKEALKGQLETLIKAAAIEQTTIDALRQQYNEAVAILEVNKEKVKSQEAFLKLNEKLQETFSSEIKNAEKLNGLFNAKGELADSDLEIRKNQLQLLADTFNKTEAAAEAQREYRMAVEEATAGLNIGKTEQQALLSATKETLDATLSSINNGEKINKELLRSKVLTGDQVVELKARNSAQLAFEGSLAKITTELKKFNDELEKTTRQINNAAELSALQNTISLLKVQEQGRAKQADLARTQLDLTRQELDLEQERKNLNEDIEANRRKSILDAQKALLDSSVLGKAFTEDQKRQFEIKFNQAEFEEFKRLTERQIEERKEQLRRDLFNLEIETSNRYAILGSQQELLVQEAILAEAQLKGQKEDALANLKTLGLRAEIIDQEREMLGKFLKSFGDILGRSIALRYNSNASEEDIQETTAKVLGNFEDELKEGGSAVNIFQSRVGGLINTITTDFAERIRTSNSVYEERLRLNAAEIEGLNAESTRRKELLIERESLERAKAEEEIRLRKEASDRTIEILNREGDAFQRIGAQLADSLSNRLGTALDDLFNAIAEGTLTVDNFKEGFKQFLFDILNNIRKTVLQETLIKPTTDFAKKSIAGFFDISEKGIENAEVTNGALKTFVTNAAGTDPIKLATEAANENTKATESLFDSFFSKLTSGFTGFFDIVKSSLTLLGSSFTGILGSVGRGLTSILPGGGGSFFGGLLSSVFGGVSSLFGFGGQGLLTGAGGFTDGGFLSGLHIGGQVPRMATGGMMRDRIPALLEPGEFVLRRAAANSIGAPALNAMNATGSMGGNVVVNIENKGTPQDAEASQPRFDGEKFIIDIVTRDIRNNGPIRKTLRGNL